MKKDELYNTNFTPVLIEWFKTFMKDTGCTKIIFSDFRSRYNIKVIHPKYNNTELFCKEMLKRVILDDTLHKISTFMDIFSTINTAQLEYTFGKNVEVHFYDNHNLLVNYPLFNNNLNIIVGYENQYNFINDWAVRYNYKVLVNPENNLTVDEQYKLSYKLSKSYKTIVFTNSPFILSAIEGQYIFDKNLNPYTSVPSGLDISTIMSIMFNNVTRNPLLEVTHLLKQCQELVGDPNRNLLNYDILLQTLKNHYREWEPELQRLEIDVFNK